MNLECVAAISRSVCLVHGCLFITQAHLPGKEGMREYYTCTHLWLDANFLSV